VVFTTAEEDAKRRDFTINGLFLDPIENRVIDYVGGQEDLKQRIVRAIGEPDQRFEEDHLRLLRAVRFAARFGFTLDRRTAEAIKRHAGQLTQISPERVAEELRLMLTPPTREEAHTLLHWHGLLHVLMRFLPEKCLGQEDDVSFLPFSSMRPEVRVERISFGLALAAVTLDWRLNASGKYDPRMFTTEQEIRVSCQAMRRALKISNEEYDQMAGSLSFGHLLGATEPSVATLKRFLAKPTSADARVLMESCAGDPDGPATRIEWLMRRLAQLEQTDVHPTPLVTGDDLTAAGLKPGPVFKRVLDAAYDAQLEDRVRTKAEALELALKLAVSR
jgi:poly(A) polymerase